MKNFGILLLAMVSCCLLQAKDRVVKQPPFIARSSSTIEIDRVVVSDTATVLDVKAFFRPHNWIQISNESYLLADNGKIRLKEASPLSGIQNFSPKVIPLPERIGYFSPLSANK